MSAAIYPAGARPLDDPRVRRQMQEEVRDILSEYVPLEAFNSRDGGAQGQGFRRASNGDDTVGVI